MPGVDISSLKQYLDQPAKAREWLLGWGFVDVDRAQANLLQMATMGVPLDLLANICNQLEAILPGCADPDMALNNLERMLGAARSPLSLATLFERDPDALIILTQIFSSSQHLSDLLVHDPESFDLLRMTEGAPVQRETLIEELAAEVASLPDEKAVMTALRRFKRRETLRISYGDIIRRQRLDVVTAQISYLADAIVESALRFAWDRQAEKRGVPTDSNGSPARISVLALGKLGGIELNYSSDIDLIFIYDVDGETNGPKPIANDEFFDRLVRDMVKLLTEPTELGAAYRVDLRLRPEGKASPLVIGLERAYHYYDVSGRTWERQAFIKARPIAGSLELGREFLSRLNTWIYRRYLTQADIAGIKALKRRIEQRTIREGGDNHDVKTGHGGIRDVEFAIQFLQLLNGGDLSEVQTGTTLTAIDRLAAVGCLTHQERSLLESNYVFLRRIEHFLQIMFDLQTHRLPIAAEELRKLAMRMGYKDSPEKSALSAFESDYASKTALNRKILNHLLHDAFREDAQTEPEIDLVLDPDPPQERIEEVLGKYGFQDVRQAYHHLTSLATEQIPFLSTRRCRHFLAAIAPNLLRAIASTPDPDSTLVNLEKVSATLGGKGVLWELFSFNPPTLKLYVDLCATSPFLSGLLISNPGMIDELMDSLVLNKLPTLDQLRSNLAELCRAAEDVEPILHSFKNSQELRVGVRDILGKDDIKATTAALSNIAQVCLEQITFLEYNKLAARMGEPSTRGSHPPGEEVPAVPPPPPAPDEPVEMVIVALGKFGGAELNYRSDLDIIFLYESDGQSIPTRRFRNVQPTSNQHFFSELGTRIIKYANRLGPYGRLYEIDPRLRPTGKSGALANSFAEFSRYFQEGEAQLWERQSLCKARVVYGLPETVARAKEIIHEAAFHHPWSPENAAAIKHMRERLEQTCDRNDLKRGPGGLVDIEFLVQMLQLKHGQENRAIRKPGTLSGLTALCEQGCLAREHFTVLDRNYRFLRTMEARLRLMNTTARDELPETESEFEKLAQVMGYDSSEKLREDFEKYTAENRRIFEELIQKETVGG